MTVARIDKFVHHLRRTVLARHGSDKTDGELLEAFVSRKDEAAFEILVRRHGPMVLGVCRRLLRNAHDAEDAFQATFLVLVRKARSIVPREMVANWLYGVARTTALRCKVLAARRRLREKQVMEMPEPLVVPRDLWNDLRPVIDQELSGLPEKYRVPIILCDLEGKSIKEAARQSQWPQGTLAGRLARARTMLAKRLVRHGLQVSGGALAGLLTENVTSAALPARAVNVMLEAARSLGAGQVLASEVVSAQVVSLTQGVLKTMFLSKIKTLTTVLLLCVIGALTGVSVCKALAQPPSQSGYDSPPPPPTPVPQPRSVQDGQIVPPAAGPSANPATVDGKILLPSGPEPRQCSASLDKEGKLVIRTQETIYNPVSRLSGGRMVVSYQSKESVRTDHYDLKNVYVYGMNGAGIDTKELQNHFKHKQEILALVTTDQFAVDPLHLRLFKEGTLLFVVPAEAELPPAPAKNPTVPSQPPVPVPSRDALPPGQLPTPVPPLPVDPSGPGNKIEKRGVSPLPRPADQDGRP